MRTVKFFLRILISVCIYFTPLPAYSLNLNKLAECIYNASKITHIDHNLLLAIYKTESDLQPYAISVCKNGRVVLSITPKSKQEAVSIASKYISLGYNVDMGIGQIDSMNLPDLNLTVEEVFDPCVNVYASAYILESCIRTFGFNSRAIDCYNKGHNASYSSLYVDRVINNFAHFIK